MRITDIALPTAVAGPRPGAARRPGSEASSAVVTTGSPRGASHPDELAAGALARAASLAQANKVVAAANEHAAASVTGDLLDATRLP
ncbi:MAG: hypothetical protein JWM02_2494 [Frankiales bacterium]|nr:hypothetical protein [Frankiales bacterium]